MYSRSYYAEEGARLSLPDNYDGTAFNDESDRLTDQTLSTPNSDEVVQTSSSDGMITSILGKSPLLQGLFSSNGGLKMPKIGVEEILILATAGFLFFSKGGDKESAIILLLLLLVN